MSLLDLPNGQMFFEMAGSGKPGLLFAHGAACTHYDWQYVVPALTSRYSVAAVDLRGYGFSVTSSAATCTIDAFAADLVRLAEHLAWDRAVFIGHSMSCRAALQAAADHPEIVTGVVLVDTTITGRSLDELESRRKERYGDDYPAGSMSRFTEMLGTGVAAQERDRILDHVRRVPREVAETVAMSAWLWDVERLDETVARLQSPVLAIQTTTMDGGSQRRSLRPDEVASGLDPLRAGKAAFETVVLPGLGHFPMLEQPAQVAAHIAAFAGQL